MVETRIAPSVHVMKAAKIDYGGDKYPCTVCDIPDSLRIPDQFSYRVGVVFD